VTAGLRALLFVLIVTTGSRYAFGQTDAPRLSGDLRTSGVLTCYVIRPGDTAALLAQRFTGNSHNRSQPWFQILDPATSAFIPKSRYAAIQSGWHVCVATEMLKRGSGQGRYHLVSSAPPARAETTAPQGRVANDLNAVWWAASLFLAVCGVVLTGLVMEKYVGERRARVDVMRAFGSKFVAEFERPLFRWQAGDPAIKSRMRLAPARRRLEILIAPADGRTYPNLSDHRRNVEYDVDRVFRLLDDAQFVNGPLHAEGRWVVVSLRLTTGKQQEGVL
jgi:hypothetical protein